MKPLFTNRIDIRRGSEGPRHDPYGYIEVTIDGRNGPVTYHGGLGEWTRAGGNIIEHDPAARDAFEQATGLTPEQAQRTAFRQTDRVIRKHLRRCGGQLGSSSGFPGETFDICSKCHAILDYHFNESAVE
jgi:hypothetical protein